jgi:hypothetical protein
MMSVLRHTSNTSPDNTKLDEMMVDPKTQSRHGHSPGSWVHAIELRSQQIQSNNWILLKQVTIHLKNDSKGVVDGIGLTHGMQRSTIKKLMPQH